MISCTFSKWNIFPLLSPKSPISQPFHVWKCILPSTTTLLNPLWKNRGKKIYSTAIEHSGASFFSFIKKLTVKASGIYACWQRTREENMFQINWINVWIWIACVKFTPATSLSSQTSPVTANKYQETTVGKINSSNNTFEISFHPHITVDKSATKHLRRETVLLLRWE